MIFCCVHQTNRTLREVRLNDCKVTVRGEDALMELATSGVNTTLTALKLSFANKNAEKKVDAWYRPPPPPLHSLATAHCLSPLGS